MHLPFLSKLGKLLQRTTLYTLTKHIKIIGNAEISILIASLLWVNAWTRGVTCRVCAQWQQPPFFFAGFFAVFVDFLSAGLAAGLAADGLAAGVAGLVPEDCEGTV